MCGVSINQINIETLTLDECVSNKERWYEQHPELPRQNHDEAEYRFHLMIEQSDTLLPW